MRGRNQKSGFTLMELVVVIVVMGVLATLALMKFTKTVEIQRYRNHKNNLIQLKSKLMEYNYKNKNLPDGPLNLAQLNSVLGTYIEDNDFTYIYMKGSPYGFEILTSRGTPDYSCAIKALHSYPQCGGNLPE